MISNLTLSLLKRETEYRRAGATFNMVEEPDGSLAITIFANGKQCNANINSSDLMMTLDDFSERIIVPMLSILPSVPGA